MNMKSYGIALLFVGALALLIGFNMDTTVYSDGGRVHNIGLLNERQNIIIFAGIMTVIGAVFLGLASKNNVLEGRSNTSSDTRKCPFCAELVKTEAIICRHCQKDLPLITENAIKQHTTVDVKNEDALKKAALERITTWQQVTFYGFLVLGLYRLVDGYKLGKLYGFLLIGAAVAARIFIISNYKKEIIDEDKRRKRRDAAQENVDQSTAIDNAADLNPRFNKENSHLENVYGEAIGLREAKSSYTNGYTQNESGEVTDCSLSKEEIEYLEKPIKAIHYISKYNISEDKLSKAISKGKIRGVLYQGVLWVQDQEI